MAEDRGPRANSDQEFALADAFAATMPQAYRLRYGRHEMAAHARIVQARNGALVHVASSPAEAGAFEDAQWICIVTDDRPGLLSLLSAAVSAHSLDILAARIYCRSPGASAVGEAVDFFAVKRLKDEVGPIVHSDLVAIGLSIENLLRGETNVEWLERRASPTSRPIGAQPIVRFQAGPEADLLVVEAPDRPGLLLTITLQLYREGVTIVRSNVSTQGQRARDEFELLEPDGGRLSASRMDVIIQRVREALAQTRAKG